MVLLPLKQPRVGLDAVAGVRFPRWSAPYNHGVATPCPLAAELRRRADRITALLLYSDLPPIDIEIQAASLRAWVEDHLPDRLPLFEMVYESRWTRLRNQGWTG